MVNLTLKPKPPSLVTGTLRVNLLPPSEVARRTQQVLIRRWLTALVASVGAVAIVFVGSYAFQAAASNRLSKEQSRTASVNSELAGFSDVTKTLAERSELEKDLSNAGGNDLAWRSVLNQVEAALPSSAKLVGYDLTAGAIPTTTTPAKSAVGLSGTFSASSKDPSDQQTAVRNLRTKKGLLQVDARNLSYDLQNKSYTFVVSFAADQTYYSGNFAVKGR